MKQTLTDKVRNTPGILLTKEKEKEKERERKRGGQYSIFLYLMFTSPAGTYVSKLLPTSEKQAQVLRY